MSIVQLLPQCHLHSGATTIALAKLERDLGVVLPSDYKDFLAESDGVEGFVTPESYLLLWSVEETSELNNAYSVGEFLPGVVLMGTNGGDTAYGFVCTNGSADYLSVPLVGMSSKEIVSMGKTFAGFIERLRLTSPAHGS